MITSKLEHGVHFGRLLLGNSTDDSWIPLTICQSLRWRHYGCDSVLNHQPHDCLLNRLFRRRSKKTSKLRVTGLCTGNSPETGKFPAQMASYAENVSIWWRHHDRRALKYIILSTSTRRRSRDNCMLRYEGNPTNHFHKCITCMTVFKIILFISLHIKFLLTNRSAPNVFLT